MNFPKLWLDELTGWIGLRDAEDVLNALHDIGALKDPPKPREYWLCNGCKGKVTDYEEVNRSEITCYQCGLAQPTESLIHVREVIE